MSKSQPLFETLKNTIYNSSFQKMQINDQPYFGDAGFFLESIRDACVNFLDEEGITGVEETEARNYVADNFQEKYDEIIEETKEWYANDILENLGIEKDKLDSVEFDDSF